MTPAIPAISLSLSVSPAGCALMSAITCDIYSLMFAMVRVCGVRLSLCLSLCLLLLQLENFICKCTQRELSQEMESGWQREESRGQVGTACPQCMWQQMSRGGEAAAINHIHSLPVERAFNLHAELHIAYGRCLPTFARSVVGWFSLDRVRVGGGGGLETYKSFQFQMFN